MLLYIKANKMRGNNKKKLLVLVKFLMTSYVAKWFACKQNHRINEGHKHLYTQTKLTKFLEDPVLTITRSRLSTASMSQFSQ